MEVPPDSREQTSRLTIASLMRCVAAVAIGLGFLKGDIAEWLPRAISALMFLAMVATVFGIPCISFRMEKNPEAAGEPGTEP
jgi:hypothetical protein